MYHSFCHRGQTRRQCPGRMGQMRKCRYSRKDPIENPDLPDKRCPAQRIWRASMSYAADRLIYDADSHLMELPDFLSAHADASSRHLLPPLGTGTTGLFDPGKHIGKEGQAPEDVRRLLQLGDRITRGPKW